MSPASINDSNQLLAWHRSFDKGFKKHPGKTLYKVNDFVRILLKKGVFEKGSTNSFSNTVYRIREILNTNPVMYKLYDSHGDVLGSFYNQELCPVTIE